MERERERVSEGKSWRMEELENERIGEGKLWEME